MTVLNCETSITDVSYKVFFDRTNSQSRSLLRFLHVRISFISISLWEHLPSPDNDFFTSIQPPEADLSPPLPLIDACQILRELMAVYDSSLLGHESPAEQEEGFKDILDVTVDPALEMCRRMTELEAKKDVTGWDRSIFLINCIVYLQVSICFHARRSLLFNIFHIRIGVVDASTIRIHKFSR